MNRMELEEGMNVLRVEGWGNMYVHVYDGDVWKITINNAKKKKLQTIRDRTVAKEHQHHPAHHRINLLLETGWSDDE